MKIHEENGAKFAFLGIDDVEVIEAAIRAENTEALKNMIATLGNVSPAEKAEIWNRYRPDQVTADNLYHAVRNLRKPMRETLRLALDKAGHHADIISQYDIVNAGNLAAFLIGFENRNPVTPKLVQPDPPTAG